MMVASLQFCNLCMTLVHGIDIILNALHCTNAFRS